MTSQRLRVSWVTPQPPCADKFEVSTTLTNLDQCDDTRGPRNTYRTIAGTAITINGLHPYSTYDVFVQAINDEAGNGEKTNISGTTEKTGNIKIQLFEKRLMKKEKYVCLRFFNVSYDIVVYVLFLKLFCFNFTLKDHISNVHLF